MGIPGNPAPDPTSATDGPFPTEDPGEHRGNSWRAANRLSPKWRVTICSGSRIAVRFTRAFQRISISMYVDISWSWAGESTQVSGVLSGPGAERNGWSNSAMRAGFIEECRL